MKPKASALLIHYRDDRIWTLKPVLEALSATTIRARTCKEAETSLCQMPCPHLALTDTVLPDGNWMDVLDMSAKSAQHVNVIVVSPVADVKLYLDAMDHGAFDFMTDAFTVPEIVHVLKCALKNAARRREVHVRVSENPVGEQPQVVTS